MSQLSSLAPAGPRRPRPQGPRRVRFAAEASASATPQDRVQLLGKACLRVDCSGVYWAQRQQSLAGAVFGTQKPLRVRHVQQPSWTANTTFSASCQAVVGRAAELVASHITPHPGGMLVCGFVPTGDGGFFRQGQILGPSAWAPRGFCWRPWRHAKPKAAPSWPVYLRQAFMQSFGGPAAVLHLERADEALTWLSGRPARNYAVAPWQSDAFTAHEICRLFQAGEAVMVRTPKTWWSVQSARVKRGRVRVVLLDPQGQRFAYPQCGVRLQRVAHTEGLGAHKPKRAC